MPRKKKVLPDLSEAKFEELKKALILWTGWLQADCPTIRQTRTKFAAIIGKEFSDETLERARTEAGVLWDYRKSGRKGNKYKLKKTAAKKAKEKLDLPPKDTARLSHAAAVLAIWTLADKVGGLAELASLVAALQHPGGIV